jgi:hypothetical protein
MKFLPSRLRRLFPRMRRRTKNAKNWKKSKDSDQHQIRRDKAPSFSTV